MATITRADIVSRALEHIGVKSATQSATAEDAKLAGEVFDSVYYRFRKLGLAPFATSAIPEWAQGSFRRIVAAELAPVFGISGQRLSEFVAEKIAARKELAEQVTGYRHSVPIKTRYY